MLWDVVERGEVPGPLLEPVCQLGLRARQQRAHGQEVLLKSVDERDGELLVHHKLLRHHDQPDVHAQNVRASMHAVIIVCVNT